MENKTGQFIARRRKEIGLTQKELAERLGVTNKAVSKWETGGGMPDVSVLETLAGVLEVSVDELLRGERETEQVILPPVQNMKRGRLITGSVTGILALAVFALQMFYLIVGRTQHFEYIIDSLFYVVNGFIIVMAAASLGMLVRKKWIRNIGLAAGGILFLINLVYGLHSGGGQSSVISVSPDLKHMAVMKYEEEAGRVTTYLNQRLCFAKVSDQFPYTADRDMKLQWLADDVCAVTYTSPDDGNVHQYVLTYGDRGNGITSDYVYTVITGKWDGIGKNLAGWEIERGIDGITIRTASQTEETYTFDECVQFGTLAVALCRNGLPQWTLVLDESCVIGKNNFLEEGGTITLCRVTMDKSAPMQFYQTQAPIDFDTEYEPMDKTERGKDLQKEMKSILKADPALTNYDADIYGSAKVVTDSEDIFWIARCAMEENDKRQAVNGIDVSRQIEHMELMAGDRFDYLMKINSRDTYIDPNHPAEKSETEGETTYRIMKGEGAYLAFQVSYGTDGSVGLVPPAMKKEIDTREKKEYSYYVPGDKEDTP